MCDLVNVQWPLWDAYCKMPTVPRSLCMEAKAATACTTAAMGGLVKAMGQLSLETIYLPQVLKTLCKVYVCDKYQFPVMGSMSTECTLVQNKGCLLGEYIFH